MELDKFDPETDAERVLDLLSFYNDANRQVALLCNHQRAESKLHAPMMAKMLEKAELMEAEIRDLKHHRDHLTKGEKPRKQKSSIKLPSNAQLCKKKLKDMKIRMAKHSSDMKLKEDNKLVALGTSKINYMDPRISVAFCKKHELPIEKVFPGTVRTKFPWAMHAPMNYNF